MGLSIAPSVEKHGSSMESISAEKSAADVIKILNSLTVENTGVFFNHDGTPLPW